MGGGGELGWAVGGSGGEGVIGALEPWSLELFCSWSPSDLSLLGAPNFSSYSPGALSPCRA